MYTYRCEACGHEFEELTTMARRDQIVCPECGGKADRSWEGSGTFGISISSEKCAFESACASSCGCGGRCGCGH